jgi:hypothetical protein
MPSTNFHPALAEHLRSRLQALRDGFRHNLALIGPPGSGKTFQLQALLAERSDRLLVAYCPLYRESAQTVLTRLTCSLLEAGVQGAPTVEPLARRRSAAGALETLLAQAEASLPQTAAAARHVESLIGRRAHAEAFTRALDLIPVLAQERRRPCVLILDEFLCLEGAGLTHAFHEIGKRVMTWPDTLFVLASSSSFRARAILRERLQLLFGQFELLTVDPVEPDRAAAWLVQELRGLRGVKAAAPFVIRWLGASPACLSVFVKRLKELAALQRLPELSEALFLRAAWDVLGHPDGTLAQWCAARVEEVARLRPGARAVDVLLHVADRARTATDLSRRLGRSHLTGSLQVLLEHDLVERKGACWFVGDPVLRCWLTAVLAARRIGAPPDEAALRARFDRHVTEDWARWAQQAQLSFPEQVVRLLASFREETVSLDSKTGRLPHFEAIRTLPAPGRPHCTYVMAEGEGKQWCCAVDAEPVTEAAVADFGAFCRQQTPRPSRKVVITRSGLEENARLLAKSDNMWVWDAEDLEALGALYAPGEAPPPA